MDDLLIGSVKVSSQEAKDAYRLSKTQFTFEVTKAGVDGKAIPKQTVGPISIEERSQVLATDATDADYAKVFALTAEHAALAAPLTIGGMQVSVRLVKRSNPTDAEWIKDEATFTKEYLLRKQGRVSQEWISHLSRKATIEQLSSPHEG